MNKRFSAAFLITLFILGIASIAAPSQAHTTLGRPTGITPYRVYDSDTNPNHAAGVTGYVFPGGGKDWTLGNRAEPPGYQSPWGSYPAWAPISWLQLRGNTYAPFGAILASSDVVDNVGDLIFAINITDPSALIANDQPDTLQTGDDIVYKEWTIYIPPEFMPIEDVNWAGGKTDNIVTNIFKPTITVKKADVKDPFGPGWWVIKIKGEKVVESTSYNDDIKIATIKFTDGHNYEEWYYVRVNGVIAPNIAGRYFFKMFMDENYPIHNAIDATPTQTKYITSTVPVENYPVLLVKGEVDPGIVEGTIRFGGYDPALYALPMPLPGRVRLVGIANDPYTGESTGRAIEARGYFNASANGHYEVEGVAPPGTYDIYASAAGYPELMVAEGIVVYPGKSVHLDIFLNPGAIVHGNIFSKHAYGEVDWTNHAWQEMGDIQTGDYPLPVSVEIYDSNEWPEPRPGYVWGDVDGTVADNYLEWEADHLKSFSPKNLTDSPYTSYDWGDAAGMPAPRMVAFPWEGAPFQVSTGGYGAKDPAGVHNGVGPAQTWWTPTTGAQFAFAFGKKTAGTMYGLYGAPTDYDGHVPQALATWVNGLEAGTYYLRAWIPGYVQTDSSGIYVDYMFTIAAAEWAGDVYAPMDVQLNGKINKTVHFHDLPGTLATAPIRGPDPNRWLIAEARDDQGNLVAFNYKLVDDEASEASILLWGFGYAGPHTKGSNTYYDFLYKSRHIRDYGMMPGTYKIYVYMRGYVQQEFEYASITLSGATTWISNHMYRGAGINVTLYSIDWQHPRVERDWIKPEKDVTVTVLDSNDVGKGPIKFWDYDDQKWRLPEQKPSTSIIPHPTWPDVPESSYLKFNGSTKLEEDGPDNNRYKVSTYDDWDEKWSNPGGFVASPSRYRDGDFNTVVALETDTYHFTVSTDGYIFKDADKYTLYATKGSQADTKLNLMIGANFTVTINFKKEGIFYHVPFNITLGYHIFNEDGTQIKSGSWDNINCSTLQITKDIIGIDGFPNYAGDWTIEFDSYARYWGHIGCEPGMPIHEYMPWYPAVDGLLMGKDYWLVAGQVGQGTQKPYNHLGPYEQRTIVTIPNAHLGGEQSIILELDLNAYFFGQLAGFTYSNELRTMSWANIIVSGAAGDFTVYSTDGFYEGFAPQGDYTMTIETYQGDVGHYQQSVSMTMPDGGSVGQNFLNFERSNVPIPEFTPVLAILSALAAAFFIFRKAKKD